MIVALLSESTERKEEPMEAVDFYQGSHNQWTKSIIRYLNVLGLPKEHCYFLSFYKQRIIPFNEEISSYPSYKKKKTISEGKKFAAKIMDFLLKFKEKPFVEIHTSKIISVPLATMLDDYGFLYKIHESGSLADKPKYYEDLIEKERQKIKAKEIQRGKWKIVSSIDYQTPAEAEKILQEYASAASLYGIEDIFQELKDYLKKHYKRNKELSKAMNEFEEILNDHPEGDELYDFIRNIKSVQDLFKNIRKYEKYKQKFGKEMAKYTRYMIKQGYVLELEKTISSLLFKLSVVLLKRVA